MNKTIENIVETICFTIIVLVVITVMVMMNSKDEKIKLLEQSLNEQIEEKQVYMNMLEKDDVGYVLETFETGEYGDNVAIYAEYTATAQDCDFMGQIDLIKAYEHELERSNT